WPRSRPSDQEQVKRGRIRRWGTGRGGPLASMSPGLRLRLRPPPLLTAKGHPRPALQSPPQRIEKQSNFPLPCAKTHGRLHLPEPSPVVAGRPFRVGKGGGRGTWSAKASRPRQGPSAHPVTNRSPTKKSRAMRGFFISNQAKAITGAAPAPPRPAPLAADPAWSPAGTRPSASDTPAGSTTASPPPHRSSASAPAPPANHLRRNTAPTPTAGTPPT